jgi:hypothetical protein
MKKIFLILVLQAGILAPAMAQFNTPEKQQVTMLKSKILLVETQVEVTRTLMDLRSRPEAQQAYKDGVANFNQSLKNSVEKYYKWGKGVEYMPVLDVEKLVRDGKAAKYAILHYTVTGSYVNPADIGPVYGKKYNDSVREFSRSKGYGIFSFQLVGGDKKLTDVYSVALPVAYPSEADMVFAMEMTHNTFIKVTKVKEYEVKEFRDDIVKYNKTIKKKTLYLEKGQLQGKTTLNDLRKGYNFQIAVVDYEKIQDAVLQNDSSIAYVLIVPVKANSTSSGSVKINLRHLVLDAKDSKVLNCIKATRINIDKVADDITYKEIKEYVE